MLENLRKEKRVPIRLKLQLNVQDSLGHAISARITTVNVSRGGICFQSEFPLPLHPGEVIRGKLESPQFKTDIHLKVAWANGCLVGASLETTPGHWLVK
jgi:hypothetical protein